MKDPKLLEETVLIRRTEEPVWTPVTKATLVYEEADQKQRQIEKQLTDEKQAQVDKLRIEKELEKIKKEKEEEQKRIEIFNKIMSS